jgi:hypothetical protein
MAYQIKNFKRSGNAFAKVARTRTSKSFPNITRRKSRISILANTAFKEAAESTMKTSGFIAVVQNGWVVKRFPNGKTERIIKVAEVKKPDRIVLY